MKRTNALPFAERIAWRTMPGETCAHPFFIADRLAARTNGSLGYPLFYTDAFDDLLCPTCANRLFWESIAGALRDEYDWNLAPVASYVYWTGAPACCSECGATLSSACGKGANA